MAVFSLNGLIYSLNTNLELNKIGVEFGFLMKIVTAKFEIDEAPCSSLTGGGYLISLEQKLLLYINLSLVKLVA